MKTPIVEVLKKGKKIERIKRALEVLNERKSVLVIDEAQELRYLRDIKKILAWSYDNLDSLSVVLSGSEVGVLEDFVGIDNYASPFYGRAIKELRLEKFDEAKSLEFLQRGFSEYGINVKEEGAHGVFDGIIGWLTTMATSERKRG